MCVSPFSVFLAFGYDMELDREKEFRTFLAEKFPSVKRGTIGIFYKEFGDKIKAAIKDPSSADKNMRFFVKKKGFQILNIPSLGARDVLVIPVKEQVKSHKSSHSSHEMYKLYSVIELVALKWIQMYRLVYRIWWRTIPLLISTEG